jgi:hypothetical protein
MVAPYATVKPMAAVRPAAAALVGKVGDVEVKSGHVPKVVV